MPQNVVPYPIGPEPEAVSWRAVRPSPRARQLERLLAVTLAGLVLAWFAVFLGLLGLAAWAASQLGTDSTLLLVALLLTTCLSLYGLAKMVLSLRKAGKVAPPSPAIASKDQPTLEEFVRRVCDDAGASAPRAIFFEPDVNAAVVIDVSPWNFLRPPSYDLYLGLGLINSVNLSGFQAVLAHELGHVTGGPVRAWFRGVEEFLGHYLSHTPGLGRFYRAMVKARCELQREREYQADRIAAFVAGTDAVLQALDRSATGREALSQAVTELKPLAETGRLTYDLYYHQHAAARELEGEPNDDLGDREHPGRAERFAALNAHPVPAPIDERTPWLLIRDAEEVRKTITALVIPTWPGVPKHAAFHEPRLIQERLEREREAPELPEKYQFIYRHRYPLMTLQLMKQWRDRALSEPWLELADAVVNDAHKQRLAKRDLLLGQRRRLLRGTARARGWKLIDEHRDLADRLRALDDEFKPFDELNAVQHFSLALQCGRPLFEEALKASEDYIHWRQIANHAREHLQNVRIFELAAPHEVLNDEFYTEHVATLRAAQAGLARCAAEPEVLHEPLIEPLPPGPLSADWSRKLARQLEAVCRTANRTLYAKLVNLLDHRERVRAENAERRQILQLSAGLIAESGVPCVRI